MLETTIQTASEKITLWANVASVDFELKQDFLWLLEHRHRQEAIKFLEWAMSKLERT